MVHENLPSEKFENTIMNKLSIHTVFHVNGCAVQEKYSRSPRGVPFSESIEFPGFWEAYYSQGTTPYFHLQDFLYNGLRY